MSSSFPLLFFLFFLQQFFPSQSLHAFKTTSQASKAGRTSRDIEFIDIEKSYQSQYGDCCEMGKKAATQRGFCSGSGYYANECKSLGELCCLEQLAIRNCQVGVKYALARRVSTPTDDIDCLRLSSFREGHEYRCCSACRMGLMAAENRLGGRAKWCTGEWLQVTARNLSAFSSLVSHHIEASYAQCCSSGLQAEEGMIVHDEPATNRKQLASLVAPRSTISCSAGYTVNETTGGCADIDECASEASNDCTEEGLFCVNTDGSYLCSKCKAGFTFDTLLGDCVDINECQGKPYPCLAGQACRNSPGSYQCLCQVGYEMEPVTGACVDVNECQTGRHNCHESLRCDNTVGSFHCVRVQDCGTGYTVNADLDVCEDVDECALGGHNCAPGYTCRNTQGSFKCDRKSCSTDQEMINGICQDRECPAGQVYNRRDRRCTQVNGCTLNSCKEKEQCVPLGDSFTCISPCPPGYTYNQTVDRCSDLDECQAGVAECGLHQECVNLIGHYDCTCRPGFQMDSTRACHDIDECTDQWWLCQYPRRCINTVGSFTCSGCAPGYTQSSLTGECTDIDECSRDGGAKCEHICTNTPGSFRCACRSGYKLGADARSCEDVDECAILKKIQEGRLQGEDRTSFGKLQQCQGVCVNTQGSFECTCPAGFSKSNGHCVDINECTETPTLCSSSPSSTLTCINTLGSYECPSIPCPVGYKRTVTSSGVHCTWNEKTSPSLKSSEHYDKLEYLHYALYSNQTGQLSNGAHLYTFYATRYRPEVENALSVKYGTYFDLRLLSSSSLSSSSSPSKLRQSEYFHLSKPSLNEATISLLKPLPGPAMVQLELILIGYKKYAYYRQKVAFTLHISPFTEM